MRYGGSWSLYFLHTKVYSVQGGGATSIFLSVRTRVVAPLILISVYREDVETIHQVLFVKWMFERVKLSWEGKTEMKTNECGSFFIGNN